MLWPRPIARVTSNSTSCTCPSAKTSVWRAVGTAIVREIAGAHGGRVELAPAAGGGGARFSVVLPVSAATTTPPGASAGSPVAATASASDAPAAGAAQTG
jgi:hypothetical protein